MQAHRKAAGLLTVFILVMSLASAMPAVNPTPAQAGVIPSPCDLVPDGAARTACKVVTNPVGAVGGAIGSIPGVPNPTDIVGDVAEVIVQPILNQIARAEADAVSSVLKDVSKFVNNSTTPVMTTDWFLRLYAIVFGLAVPFGIIMFYTRLGRAVKNVDPSEASWSFVSMMAFLGLAGLVPGIVGLVVEAMDNQLAPAWMSSAGGSANDTLNGLSAEFSKSVSATNAAVPILLPLIFLFVGLIGGILLELMLLFREAMLYIVTATEVVALTMVISGNAEMAWRTTRKLAVLCTFKVIIAFILTVGFLLLNGGSAPPVLMGMVVLFGTPLIAWGAYRNWGEHEVRFLPGGWSYTQSALRRLRAS